MLEAGEKHSVLAVYSFGVSPKNDEGNNLSYDFFKEEYLLNYEISKFKKPISLLNGTMGEG